MQYAYPAHNPEQSDFTGGLSLMKPARSVPALFAMDSHVSPAFATIHFAQLLGSPGWVCAGGPEVTFEATLLVDRLIAVLVPIQ